MTLGALGSGTISSLTYPVDGRDRSANAKIASTAAGAQGRVRGEIRSVLGEGPLSLKKPHDHRSHKGGEQTVLGWRCDDAFAPTTDMDCDCVCEPMAHRPSVSRKLRAAY